MSDSVKKWLLRLSSYHFFISIPIVSTLSIIPRHYIIFIQLDSFTICTFVHIIILFLNFTITFRQRTSACTHRLTLDPQYDMHITSYYYYQEYIIERESIHIDELNACDPYIYIIIFICMVRQSRANRRKHCTAMRGIFQKAA